MSGAAEEAQSYLVTTPAGEQVRVAGLATALMVAGLKTPLRPPSTRLPCQEVFGSSLADPAPPQTDDTATASSEPVAQDADADESLGFSVQEEEEELDDEVDKQPVTGHSEKSTESDKGASTDSTESEQSGSGGPRAVCKPQSPKPEASLRCPKCPFTASDVEVLRRHCASQYACRLSARLAKAQPATGQKEGEAVAQGGERTMGQAKLGQKEDETPAAGVGTQSQDQSRRLKQYAGLLSARLAQVRKAQPSTGGQKEAQVTLGREVIETLETDAGTEDEGQSRAVNSESQAGVVQPNTEPLKASTITIASSKPSDIEAGEEGEESKSNLDDSELQLLEEAIKEAKTKAAKAFQKVLAADPAPKQDLVEAASAPANVSLSIANVQEEAEVEELSSEDELATEAEDDAANEQPEELAVEQIELPTAAKDDPDASEPEEDIAPSALGIETPAMSTEPLLRQTEPFQAQPIGIEDELAVIQVAEHKPDPDAPDEGEEPESSAPMVQPQEPEQHDEDEGDASELLEADLAEEKLRAYPTDLADPDSTLRELLSCDRCPGKVFVDGLRLSVHQRGHGASQCRKCHRVARSAHAALRHRLLRQCRPTVFQRSAVRLNVKAKPAKKLPKYKPDKAPSDEAEPPEASEPPEVEALPKPAWSLTCNRCAKAFDQPSKLARHKMSRTACRNNLKRQEPAASTSLAKSKAPKSGSVTGTRPSIHEALLRERASEGSCLACGRSFTKRWSLVRHLQKGFCRKEATDKAPKSSVPAKPIQGRGTPCPGCGKLLAGLKDAAKHGPVGGLGCRYERIRRSLAQLLGPGQETATACPKCHRDFARSAPLLKHLESPVACGISQRREQLKQLFSATGSEESLRCPKCAREGSSKGWLVEHLRTSASCGSDSAKFACDTCEKTFGQAYQMAQHSASRVACGIVLRRRELETMMEVAKTLGETGEEESSRPTEGGEESRKLAQDDSSRSPSFPCPRCPFAAERSYQLRQHLESRVACSRNRRRAELASLLGCEPSEAPAGTPCPRCGRASPSTKWFAEHWRSEACDRRLSLRQRPGLSCNKCGKPFRNAYKLRNHRAKGDLGCRLYRNRLRLVQLLGPGGETATQCPNCDSQFGTSSSLLRHLESPVACGISQQRRKLDRILTGVKKERQTGNPELTEDQAEEEDPEAESPHFRCPKCEREGGSREWLREHLRTSSTCGSLAERFVCDGCGKTFGQGFQMHQHSVSKIACRINLGKRRLEELLSDQTLKADRSMDGNQESKSEAGSSLSDGGSGKPSLPCPRCPAAFQQLFSLRKHMESAVACERNNRRAELVKLLGFEASPRDQATCPKCAQGGSGAWLRDHLRSSRSCGEQSDRFPCEDCGAAFGQATSLRSHQSTEGRACELQRKKRRFEELLASSKREKDEEREDRDIDQAQIAPKRQKTEEPTEEAEEEPVTSGSLEAKSSGSVTEQRTCPKCQRSGRDFDWLREHLRTSRSCGSVGERFRCPECGKGFSTTNGLKKHTGSKAGVGCRLHEIRKRLAELVGEEEATACPKCRAQFKNQHTLLAHLESQVACDRNLRRREIESIVENAKADNSEALSGSLEAEDLKEEEENNVKESSELSRKSRRIDQANFSTPELPASKSTSGLQTVLENSSKYHNACPKCQRSGSYDWLREHLRASRSCGDSAERFACPSCSAAFPHLFALAKHRKTGRACEINRKRRELDELMARASAEKQDHETSEDQAQPTSEDQDGGQKTSRGQHSLKREASEARSEVFESRPARQASSERSQGSEAAACPKCGREGSGRAWLLSHLANSRSCGDRAERFPCANCPAAFPTAGDLGKHWGSGGLACQLNLRRRRLRDHSAEMDGGDADNSCPRCAKKYSSRQSLAKHLESVIPCKTKVAADDDQQLQCRDCKELFVSLHTLREHLRSAEACGDPSRRFVCDGCYKGFFESYSLFAHCAGSKACEDMAQRVRASKAFPCPDCGHRFTEQRKLTAHRDHRNEACLRRQRLSAELSKAQGAAQAADATTGPFEDEPKQEATEKPPAPKQAVLKTPLAQGSKTASLGAAAKPTSVAVVRPVPRVPRRSPALAAPLRAPVVGLPTQAAEGQEDKAAAEEAKGPALKDPVEGGGVEAEGDEERIRCPGCAFTTTDKGAFRQHRKSRTSCKTVSVRVRDLASQLGDACPNCAAEHTSYWALLDHLAMASHCVRMPTLNGDPLETLETMLRDAKEGAKGDKPRLVALA